MLIFIGKSNKQLIFNRFLFCVLCWNSIAPLGSLSSADTNTGQQTQALKFQLATPQKCGRSRYLFWSAWPVGADKSPEAFMSSGIKWMLHSSEFLSAPQICPSDNTTDWPAKNLQMVRKTSAKLRPCCILSRRYGRFRRVKLERKRIKVVNFFPLEITHFKECSKESEYQTIAYFSSMNIKFFAYIVLVSILFCPDYSLF